MEFNSINDIEVKWNPFSLPNKALYSIRNSRLAEEYLYKFYETKHPDFRVRVVFDHPNSQVEIGSRVSTYATSVVRLFRTFGIKKISWKPNSNIKKIRALKHKELQ